MKLIKPTIILTLIAVAFGINASFAETDSNSAPKSKKLVKAVFVFSRPHNVYQYTATFSGSDTSLEWEGPHDAGIVTSKESPSLTSDLQFVVDSISPELPSSRNAKCSSSWAGIYLYETEDVLTSHYGCLGMADRLQVQLSALSVYLFNMVNRNKAK